MTVNRKNIIKQSGLTLIILTLGLFILSLFLNSYRLTEDAVKNTGFNEEQKKFFLKRAYELTLDKSNKWVFIGVLNRALEGMNRDLKMKYQISQKRIDALISSSISPEGIQFDPARAAQFLDVDTSISRFQQKGIIDYTGWIKEKKYSDTTTFINDVEHAIGNFNESIPTRKGLDEYIQKVKVRDLLIDSGVGLVTNHRVSIFLILLFLTLAGALMFILPLFSEGEPGIKNDGIYHRSISNRGWSGILLGSFLILFYILVYFYPVYITEWILLSDVASTWLFGRNADRWFLYGFLYTLAILVMGVRFLTKYRHVRYQQYRTLSVTFFQLGFAFILPQILFALNLPEVDLKNIWPLDYSFFFDWRIEAYQQSGILGMTMFFWGIGLIVAGVPLFTYFFGKRWYCSWVCGCGGLAETAGDGFRHLSSKKLSAWKIERFMVHGVLVFAIVMTVWVLYTVLTDTASLLGLSSFRVREIYGFMIGSIFAGVVGTGFYPWMGSRVWCRFGCPLAAYIGLVQRFKSRFRITTNGGQCISCGNCSTYCEMGIDVRWYAQRGQNIIRSSCVGCGICAAVCPRGVLKLENKQEKGRFNKPVLTGNDGILEIKEKNYRHQQNK